ncbi:MAG: hypothetical protein AAGI46_08715 [Planctomycetota bacterium]
MSLTLAPAVQAVVLFDGEVLPLGQTFDRPFVDGFDLGPSNQGVGFDAIPFEVSASGTYTFTTETFLLDDGVFWDGAILIYADVFDPEAPDSNLIAYEGVGGGTFDPTNVAVALDPDRPYVFVQAGVTSFDFGPYNGTVDGIGQLNFGHIPEPGTGLILTGVACLALCRRGG